MFINHPVLNKIMSFWEFVPIFLIAFIIMAERDMTTHTTNMSCKLLISLICILVFIIVFFGMKKPKAVAIIIAAVFYVSLIGMKRNFLGV